MHTEDEAKESVICHQTMARGDRYRERCIASECAAWRWASMSARADKPTIEELEEILDGPKPNIEILPSGEVKARTHGFCGLAGEPK